MQACTMRRFAVAAGAVVALALSVVPAAADSHEEHIGGLAEKVRIGTNRAWTASVDGGWFLVANERDPDMPYWAYQRVDPLSETGERHLRVNLVVRARDEGGRAEAGILFDVDKRSGSGWAAMVGADGKLRLHHLGIAGFELMDTAEDVEAALDGSDVLEVVHTPKHASIRLNGEEAITRAHYKNFDGSVGIIARGRGLFGFDGWEIADAADEAGKAEGSATDALPPPGGGTQ